MSANVKFTISADVLLNELNIFTMKELAAKYKVGRGTIRKRIKSKYNNFNYIKKYSLNENFFQKIDSEEKAYWLGFLYADGCIGNKHGYTIQLNLSTIDNNHIEKFRKALNYTGKVKISKRGDSYLHISSKATVTNLINVGCVPNKTLILEFPTEEQLPKHLIKHFIRGYFDGDGCLHFNGYNRSLSFSGTNLFLKGIMNYLNREIEIPLKRIFEIKNTKIYSLYIVGKYDMMMVLNHIYGDSTIYLDRKYNKYLEFCELIGSINTLHRRIFHKTCTYQNCKQKHKGRGFCETHLRQYRKGQL